MNRDRKNDRKRAKRRAKIEKKRHRAPANKATQQRLLRPAEMSITTEVEYIVRRASEHDARVVKIGELVLFSTDTGDAWLLDSADNLALCLARGGERQPYRIVETPATFAIDWTSEFAIEEDAFVVHNRSGQTRVTVGYPVAQIQQALSNRAR